MRVFTVAAVLLGALGCAPVMAQTASKSASATTVHYTTSDTDIGTLLDDPAARAVVDKYLPNFSEGEQIDMARGMTLKAIQPYASDTITDKVLADIDAELAKLKSTK